jgi:hypothetical protein
MAGILTTVERQAILNSLEGSAVFASAHTADPGQTGTSEVTGGSPAYARKAVTWTGATSATPSVAALATLPVFDIPGSTTLAYVGLWSLVTGGTFYGSWQVTSEVFAGQGTYTLTAGSISL